VFLALCFFAKDVLAASASPDAGLSADVTMFCSRTNTTSSPEARTCDEGAGGWGRLTVGVTPLTDFPSLLSLWKKKPHR
jgi:hypothetical protein